jgi:hypothetical protein
MCQCLVKKYLIFPIHGGYIHLRSFAEAIIMNGAIHEKSL